MRTFFLLATAAAVALTPIGFASPAVAERLGRNDARFNYWRSVSSTMWPILDGRCG